MGEMQREEGSREEGVKGQEKNWYNCNSITNKIYLKKE